MAERKSGRGKSPGKQKAEPLADVKELATAKGIPEWEMAGLTAAAGWAPGKQVTEAEFDTALDNFRNRPQGGGRI